MVPPKERAVPAFNLRLVIQRTSYATLHDILHMSIDHSGLHIFMPHEFLNSSDIKTRIQHVGRERMPPGMRRGMFSNLSP